MTIAMDKNKYFHDQCYNCNGRHKRINFQIYYYYFYVLQFILISIVWERWHKQKIVFTKHTAVIDLLTFLKGKTREEKRKEKEEEKIVTQPNNYNKNTFDTFFINFYLLNVD